MESEKYSYSYGRFRSDWHWDDADSAYEAGVKHRDDLGRDDDVLVWVRRVERVDL
jgi:hypothetical protein